MKKNKAESYITELHMNGLRGRMLRMPALEGKKREILLLYGQHASLERMFGFAEVLNEYGAVTMPDIPGFGGMESFYKIGEKPDINTFADYLAAFMKLRYKRRRVTIVAMSFGFPLIVRTLQRYPDLAKRVDILVSTVGFVHHDDFVFDKKSYWGLRTLGKVGSYRLPAAFMRNIILRGYVIRGAYGLVKNKHSKMHDATEEEYKKRVAFEVELWRINDVRTRLSTLEMMLTIDVCGAQVNVPTYHVAPDQDRYFDNKIVEQHMRIIFPNFESVPTKMPAHAPSIIASAKEARPYVPARIRKLLNQ